MMQDIHATDPRIPEELIQAMRQNDCILLVGSGLCRYARTSIGGSPPICWKDTLRGLVTACKKNRHIDQFQKKDLDTLISSGSLLEAGSKLQDYLRAKDESQSLLSKRLEEILLCDVAKVGYIYLLLAQIPFRGYCTINYDRFIEDACMQVDEQRPITFNLTSIEDARQEYLARISKPSKQKFVLKLLGDVDHPASLNLDDRYLQDWLGQNVEKAKALEDIFLDSHILLIGFEPDDPDLAGLLANRMIFDLSSESHWYYILIERKVELSLTKGELHTILYESKTNSDDFDLVSILESILRLLSVEPVTGERTLSPIKQKIAQNASIQAPQKTGLVHIFISWTQEDELQKRELLKYLNSLVSIGTISVWAGEFSYGIGKNKQVAENLKKAEIFLPLVSVDYFKDKDCEQELKEAIARYSNDSIRLIPVLLRTCPWQPYFRAIDLPPVLPRNEVPVMDGSRPDQAYTKIVETIAQVIEELRTESLREQKNDYQHPPSPLPQPLRMKEFGTFENKLAFAVIIGVANYPNVSQLSDVVLKDARDIRSLLRSPECGYLESNVKLLLDKKATVDAVHDKLDWIAKTATPESAAIIFFSGHGLRLQTASQTIHYLLPYNYDPMNIEKTAISGEKLTRLLNAIKTQRLLVIFDCCHSGGTGETKAAESIGTLKVADKEFKHGFEEQYLAQLAKGTGRVIMASSRPDEPAYILPGMDNSLFTHYLLEALRGKAFTRGDGLIRVFDVFDYVSDNVPTRRSQHPIFKAEVENNFPIALYQGGQKMDLK